MNLRTTLSFCAGVAVLAQSIMAADDPFAENVRTTAPLTAEEQLKTFQVPEGFQMQLVASDPDIRKPMNMAFDAKGRLWLTDSREYPYAAPLDKPGRDAIKIFEDFDSSGRARKITTFVDGLNIPIGLYPYKNGVIAWSIPNIWFFQDTDGDGKADKREVLFGPLGWERDTHGNNASFRRGFDGWLYITHGYNNTSTIRGRDGSTITLNSGNTYRVRLDGSSVQQYTWGQVNPFGLCFDPAGDLFSADCHSAPIYQLLRGAYYPSFGKPHDGLGFAPTLMQHSHGSTAISGIVFQSDPEWPAEYQNNIFVGNVMTSRVNRDQMVQSGSAFEAKEMPDLVKTSDPWFRPVDLQLGPDGALYIADFYNRIIGHYEVPLTHPGRDRERGRIWRLVYKSPKPLPDLSRLKLADLAAELGHSNLSRRLLATHELVDRFGEKAVAPAKKILRSRENALAKVHALWVLHNLGRLESAELMEAARGKDPILVVHALRALSERSTLDSKMRQLLVRALESPDARIRRAAGDALGRHPVIEQVRPLIAAYHKAGDAHLKHTLLMAVRNQMLLSNSFVSAQITFTPVERTVLRQVASAIHREDAAEFLLNEFRASSDERIAAANLRHVARYLPPEKISLLTEAADKRFGKNLNAQLEIFRALQTGLKERGLEARSYLLKWGSGVASRLFAQVTSGEKSPWQNHPAQTERFSLNPWVLQERLSTTSNKPVQLLSSLPPGGEQLTGILRSPPFSAPASFSFLLAGHDGPPGEPAQNKNRVLLRETSSGRIIKEIAAPRSDKAQLVRWDLSAEQGKSCTLEIVDANQGDAYAWLAAGEFQPAVITTPTRDPRDTSILLLGAIEIARSLHLTEMAPRLEEIVSSASHEMPVRLAAASAAAAVKASGESFLISLYNDQQIAPSLAADLLANFASPEGSRAALVRHLTNSPTRLQARIGTAMAGSKIGAEMLMRLAEAGQVTLQLFRDKALRDKLVASAPSLTAEIERLSANLPSPSLEADRLISAKKAAYSPLTAKPFEGAKVFTKACSQCHQVDGQGMLIGPQLDGIGNRGLERLLEDILDPNRNVDVNFRSKIFRLTDGEVVTGLVRRVEGEVIVVADSTGKEMNLSKSKIELERQSDTSLMPGNFADILSPQELNDLLAFLLAKSARPPE